MSEATPRPWRVGRLDMNRERHIQCNAGAESAAQTADVCLVIGKDSRMEADAALIVRAVNAHEALVRACSETLEALENGSDEVTYLYSEHINALRAALKLAKGEQ